jgi:hypothetical protein
MTDGSLADLLELSTDGGGTGISDKRGMQRGG